MEKHFQKIVLFCLNQWKVDIVITKFLEFSNHDVNFSLIQKKKDNFLKNYNLFSGKTKTIESQNWKIWR